MHSAEDVQHDVGCKWTSRSSINVVDLESGRLQDISCIRQANACPLTFPLPVADYPDSRQCILHQRTTSEREREEQRKKESKSADTAVGCWASWRKARYSTASVLRVEKGQRGKGFTNNDTIKLGSRNVSGKHVGMLQTEITVHMNS